jgi:hypothetical protein
LALATLVSASVPASAQESPVEELLRLHNRQRAAHVLNDAGDLVDAFEDSLVELNHGNVTTTMRVEMRRRFDDYLRGVRFLEWEDIRPPRIRLSPDARWADVIVEKRVRTLPADTLRTKHRDDTVFAWLERWVRKNSRWRLATIASTDRSTETTDSTPLAAQVRAWEILHRARLALGGDEAVARVGTVRFRADCDGPSGPFWTTVASARDGRVALRQGFPTRPRFAAGIGLDGGWQLSGNDPPSDSLGTVSASVVTAHEMHLLAMSPEARYADPVALGSGLLDGVDASVVRFRDGLGAPVDFFYDLGTGRPLGFRIVNHTGRGAGEILTRFDDWRRVGQVLLPFAVSMTQGSDIYRYQIVEASTDWLTDRAFQPGGLAPSSRWE